MSFADRIDDATLTVLLDVRHPLCALALGPTIEFGRERGIEINWLPVEAPTLRPPSEPSPDDDRSTLHRRHRANMIRREIIVYGQAQGLTLVDYYRDAPGPAVRAGWLWVREHASAPALESFLQETFRAYWSGELEASDVNAVARIIAATVPNARARDFRAWFEREGNEVTQSFGAQLVSRGLAGAPIYHVAEQVFLGRQHLPMIGWLLDGQRGPGPI